MMIIMIIIETQRPTLQLVKAQTRSHAKPPNMQTNPRTQSLIADEKNKKREKLLLTAVESRGRGFLAVVVSEKGIETVDHHLSVGRHHGWRNQ